MFDWLTEPLAFPFMQKALFTALIVAIVCAVLSCYLVLKGWSLMGDAISHAVLPGIVLAFMAGIPISVGAFLSGLFCAVSVGYLKGNSRIKEDTVLGIVFSGMFALGLVLFTKTETSQHLLHLLFGNLLGIHNDELWQTIIISSAVFFMLILKRRDLMLYCFDPHYTKVIGLPYSLLHYGLLILLVLTVISAMQVVGVILVIAMLISPGITAQLLTKRFDLMLVFALCSSTISVLLGVLLSYHLDADTGPCIIILQSALFLSALIWSKVRVKIFIS